MSRSSRNPRREQEYGFRLGDGHQWRLIAGRGMEPWLERMAAIMELGECGSVSGPKVFFVRGWDRRGIASPHLAISQTGKERALPQSGWRPHLLHFVRFWDHPGIPDSICEIIPEETPKQGFTQMREFLYWVYQRAMDRGGMPFHAGLVAKNSIACILTGRSEAGKSTCCSRIPSPWRALADDEVLVVRDQTGRYAVHPFPTWSDYVSREEKKKTWRVETAVPLTAVFFLQQARTDEIVPLNRAKAAVFISALSWPEILPPLQSGPLKPRRVSVKNFSKMPANWPCPCRRFSCG